MFYATKVFQSLLSIFVVLSVLSILSVSVHADSMNNGTNAVNETGNTTCNAVLNNGEGATDARCKICADPVLYKWWPCDAQPAICQGNCVLWNHNSTNNGTSDSMNNETQPSIFNHNITNSSCKTVSDNGHGVTDIHCAVCGPPLFYRWWPCDVKPSLCQGECGSLVGNSTGSNETSNSSCNAVQSNGQGVSDAHCKICADPVLYRWWPCDAQPALCQGNCVLWNHNSTDNETSDSIYNETSMNNETSESMNNETLPSIFNHNLTANSSCKPIPVVNSKDKRGVTAEQCASCAPPLNYKNWPCNAEPALCQGECSPNIETSSSSNNDTAAVKSICNAVFMNSQGVVDSQCARCGPPMNYKHWPCSSKPYLCEGDCGPMIDNPIVKNKPTLDANKDICVAIFNGAGGVTDDNCGRCGPPEYYPWWPCNMKPSGCRGKCSQGGSGNAPSTEEDTTNNQNDGEDSGSLTPILIPIVVVAALVVVAAVFFYQRRNVDSSAVHKYESEMGGRDESYKRLSI